MFSGSLVAIVTPMHADGSLDLAAWDRLLDLHLESGTSGVIVGGSTGESVALDDAEQELLLRRARARLGSGVALLAGVGGSVTSQVARRAAALAGLGLDGLLVVTPAYNRPTQEGLFQHFAAVAAAAAAPVLLYNVPSRTACDLLPATVARLAALPKIVGIKEAIGGTGRIAELRALVPAGFDLLSGDDPSAREAVRCGACGVISVTANLVPAAMSAMMAAALRGDAALAEQLDAPLAGLHRDLGVEPNPIPVKWALAEMGLIEPGIRLPLTWLSEAARPRVRAALQAAQASTATAKVRSA
jgi:4-hydroxy-tetrahydrodipicolinate synthase